MAAHLGEADENKINDMSYVWFQAILETAGKILNFESVSNMYGRTSFEKKGAQEIQKIIMESNPLHKKGVGNAAQTLINMPSKMTIVESGKKEAQLKQAEKTMGDTSWFADML